MNSADVMEALARRHAKDVWVPECNLGSAMRGCRRLDGWAMRRSWSPMTTIGYEVKVSRQDFLRDDKFHEYRSAVHELWFACPRKLIDPAEIPPGIGLLWVDGGGRAIAKRRAVRQEPDPEKVVRLMTYVLMSRTTVVANMHETGGRASIDEWRAWVDGRAESAAVGARVRAAIAEKVEDVRRRCRELEADNRRWQKIAARMEEMGFDVNSLSEWHVERELDRLRGVIDEATCRRVAQLGRELVTLSEKLANLRGTGGG